MFLGLSVGPAVTMASLSASAWDLTIPGATGPSRLLGAHPTGDRWVPQVLVSQATTGLQIQVPWDYEMPATVDCRPGGLEVVFDKVFSSESSRSLAPGIVLHSFAMGTVAGPEAAWDVTVRPGSARVVPVAASELPASSLHGGGTKGTGGVLGLLSGLVGLARSAGSGPTLAPVSEMASASGAVAAVNGGYFSWSDRLPVGLLEVGGRAISGPLFGRAAIALWPGAPRIARVESQPWVELPDQESAEIDFLNFPPQEDALMLYTPAWGERTRSQPRDGSFEVGVAASGRVVGEGEADLGIPPGGFVLAGTGPLGRWLEARVRRGDRIVLHPDIGAFWGDRPDVMGGGPILVRDGRVDIEDEHFPDDILGGRDPRTAIGVRPDGTIVIVGVEGDQAHESVGMTLLELAHFMVERGVADAMNLDGGGSTTIWAQGAVLNRPSDGSERAVADALVVIPHAAAGRTGRTE